MPLMVSTFCRVLAAHRHCAFLLHRGRDLLPSVAQHLVICRSLRTLFNAFVPSCAFLHRFYSFRIAVFGVCCLVLHACRRCDHPCTHCQDSYALLFAVLFTLVLRNTLSSMHLCLAALFALHTATSFAVVFAGFFYRCFLQPISPAACYVSESGFSFSLC